MGAPRPPATPRPVLHVALHLAAPILAALAFYRPAWRGAALVLLATMAVDVDHLLADPVYDPERCSLGFHPLHSLPAVVLYAALFLLPWITRGSAASPGLRRAVRVAHLVGAGLLIHMALDGLDCVV